jgi:hypothetical protein
VWGECAAVTLSYMGIVVVTLLILLCSLKEHGLSLFNIQKLAMYAAGAGGDSFGHPALTVQDGPSGFQLLHMVHDALAATAACYGMVPYNAGCGLVWGVAEHQAGH